MGNPSRLIRFLAAVLIGVLVIAGCGSDDDDEGTADDTPSEETGDAAGDADAAALLGEENPGTGEPVKVGLVSDGSHSTVDLGYELDVAEATVEFLNQYEGGIAGRPIELVTCITEAQPAKGTDCGNQMVEKQVAVVTIGSSAVSESIWQPVHDAGIPIVLYAASSAKVALDPESTFMLSSPTAGLVDVPIAAAKDVGETKVSVVVIDVPAAVSLYTSVGPGMFEEQGIELDVLRVPPGTPDMSPQMQTLVGGDPGVVHVIGNDTFCTSAFNGLHSAGFEGTVTTVSQCLSDIVKESVPGEFLEGIRVSSTAPLGDKGDASVQKFDAVMAEYGSAVDEEKLETIGAITMYTILYALAEGTESLTGEVTPQSVISALRAMPEKELPGSGGQMFRCDGTANPLLKSSCVGTALLTTLDGEGNPTTYETVGNAPAED